MALKKLGSAGRFGARYGRKIKHKINDVEKILRAKHTCPFCKKVGVKRLSVGIWYCNKCDSKYAGQAYNSNVK
ncbi:50S ribosomal protein L37ae [Candidatus Woesearchaeota archaeon]|jgi:large subunit ribosomal protein L37Ae|nr:50S ribosomal protein L37ae [Candidatus Woesearchaeota archaeon]MBT4114031.1 50S ribosomal protein L37ae [Candidatus Woesearchaeota archaeon]MBT4248112.1 50S ribosomal protein L37ae [Candidatus Woesearchaeota archaeon]